MLPEEFGVDQIVRAVANGNLIDCEFSVRQLRRRCSLVLAQGFYPGTSVRGCFITPKALANTFGVLESRGLQFPRVCAARQPWAEIRERLRRKAMSREDLNHLQPLLN
jgi:hypothetical protein